MIDMTQERWRYTSDYIHRVFGQEEKDLAQFWVDVRAAGLPDIAISAEVGRLLAMLTSSTRGQLAIEVGTLGGYSARWIAKSLGPAGRLITVEREPKHADFARAQIAKAGLGERVEIRVGDALAVLPRLARQYARGSVDVIFLDADKAEYPEYFRILRPLLAVGGWLIADNALGSSSWWIDEESNPSRRGADELNRKVAEDTDFEAVGIPLRQGLLIARRMRAA